MILTQTCDIENRKYYQVAPIYPETKQAKLENMRKMTNWTLRSIFRPSRRMWRKIVMWEVFAPICVVPKAYFPPRLCAYKLGRKTLQRSANCVARKARRVLWTAFRIQFPRQSIESRVTMRVVTCFYRSGEAVKITLALGTGFPVCESCETTRWIRVSD